MGSGLYMAGFEATLSSHLSWCDTTEANWVLLVNRGLYVTLLLPVDVHIYIARSTFGVSLNPSLPEWGPDQQAEYCL